VIEVDDIVGRIINALHETGQAENTLVFFTSDNGPEEDTWPDTGYTPFRGGKGSTWEGGMRVPGIAYWPGTIEAGRISDGLFDLADLFNTSLNLAGAKDKIPTDRYIDGVDQTSFLLTDDGLSNRRSVFYYLNEKLAAVRWNEYKAHAYIVEVGNGEYEAMGSMQNATIQQAAKSIFYHLYTDPKERRAVTIRKLWLAPILQGEMARHKMSLIKYPPKKPQVTIE
jgi:arylsulfatase